MQIHMVMVVRQLIVDMTVGVVASPADGRGLRAVNVPRFLGVMGIVMAVAVVVHQPFMPVLVGMCFGDKKAGAEDHRGKRRIEERARHLLKDDEGDEDAEEGVHREEGRRP